MKVNTPRPLYIYYTIIIRICQYIYLYFFVLNLLKISNNYNEKEISIYEKSLFFHANLINLNFFLFFVLQILLKYPLN